MSKEEDCSHPWSRCANAAPLTARVTSMHQALELGVEIVSGDLSEARRSPDRSASRVSGS